MGKGGEEGRDGVSGGGCEKCALSEADGEKWLRPHFFLMHEEEQKWLTYYPKHTSRCLVI